MYIALAGYFPCQYSIEEIETYVRGVHSDTRVWVG